MGPTHQPMCNPDGPHMVVLAGNLMRPFPGHQSGSHRVFNFRLSHARLIVENTFGILTSQWRMYRGVIGVSPANVDACVKATCVLHNFLRRTSKTTNRTTRPPAGQPGPSRAPSADGDAVGLQPVARVGSNNASREAIRVRETVVSYFSNDRAATWQPADPHFKTALLRATKCNKKA
ncbi:hypothetical protein N1851_033012 [Merluccius polli]|uniref:DDE Tnp4 domain-containing protein n=1 Tax=Merluccius polli TaxID=89951 RepID=A0AA47M1Z5_MERPO|nr:hypothetical protein N1851_033012 [Merluccius polli]